MPREPSKSLDGYGLWVLPAYNFLAQKLCLNISSVLLSLVFLNIPFKLDLISNLIISVSIVSLHFVIKMGALYHHVPSLCLDLNPSTSPITT